MGDGELGVGEMRRKEKQLDKETGSGVENLPNSPTPYPPHPN
jgi:hypothetical protein